MSARHLRFFATPLTLALCFALFLVNEQQLSGSSAASGADHGKSLPSPAGDAAVDHLKREGIYDRLMAAIEADRYRITTASGASFAAVNSAQHLRAEFGRDGTQLSPQPKNAQSEPPQKTARRDWQMRLRLYGYGYGDATQEVAARLTRTDGNRIETTYVAHGSERPALSEWHINKRAGLEHGFTIAERPGVNIAAEPLRVRMKVEGDLEARLADGGGAVVFAHRGGREALRYDHLVVEDALGRRLDAWMEAGGGEVSIVVDEAGATYPLTIDPLFTEVRKLTGENGDFGNSVAISNDTVVVAARDADGGKGAAYVFERNQGGADKWDPVATLPGEGGEFGFSVAISDDTVVVGARLADGKGAAYIFERNRGGADLWNQVEKLTADDGAMNDQFGFSVAISDDTVVVGASGKGAAYIFERHKGGADQWDQVTTLTGGGSFGSSVAISENTVVVGAPGINEVYIFGRHEGGADQWNPVTTLTKTGGSFGISVSISSNRVVVGASDADDGKGAAYIYERNEGGADEWGEVKMLPGEGGDFGRSVGISFDTVVVAARLNFEAYIYERNEGGADNWGKVQTLTGDGFFGSSAGISFDTVVVGAPANDNEGGAYIYTIECDEWVERRKKTEPDGQIGDEFGVSVSISGDTAVVGAFHADSFIGAVYVFERNEGGADNWNRVQRLTPSDTETTLSFGFSVSISPDTIVVGAPRNDNLSVVYIFERDKMAGNTWVEVAKRTGEFGNFGYSVGVNNDTVIVGDPLVDEGRGAAYIFERNRDGDNNWGQVQKLTPPAMVTSTSFGASVSINSDTLIVGAPDEITEQGEGAAYIFARNKDESDTWSLVKRLADKEGDFGASVGISFDTVVVGASVTGMAYIFERNKNGADEWGEVAMLPVGGISFGFSVGISADTVVVGAHGINEAYIFARNKDGADKWGLVQTLTPSNGTGVDNFGFSVSISNDTVIVGAYTDDDAKGAAYIYARECESPSPCAEMPAELPAGSAGIAYSASIAATSPGSYYYSMHEGMLPPGYSLHPTTGIISGLTRIIGSYNFTVRAQTQEGCIITQSYTLEIGCPEITLNPVSIPNGTVGTPYSATVSASPATGSYTFTIIDGSLPPGLSLNATTGKIAGMPTTNGLFFFRIKASGFGSCSGEGDYSISIGSGGCSMITLADLPGGKVGKIYSRSVAATPAGAYSYSLTEGSLPPGVTLYGANGLLYGYPTTAGTYKFTIKAKDNRDCEGSKEYSVTIDGK